MRINPKSQKGAITLIVLVTMLFLITFLMTMYIRISNKAQTSAETTKQIAEKYNNVGEAETIYNSYFAESDVIPIYTKEQLKKIGSGEQVKVNGKIYTFTNNGYYTLMSDLDLGGYYDAENETWTGTQWEPLPLSDSNGTQYEFIGTLDGLGNTITGMYINNSEGTNKGLFGTLKGTVKNLSIEKSYIKAKSYVGSIAGKNEGTITNCYNTASIIGETNVTGGYFKSITTGEQIEVWSDSILDENAYFVSGSYTATAPKGFKVSKNVFEQTIEDGMVILDSEGNEFVWVPVKDGEFERTNWSDNKPTTGLDIDDYTENAENDPTGEYANMVASVSKYGGFYIGRYEAGSNENRATTRTNETVLVKKGAYPYNNVCWGVSMTNYEEEYKSGSDNYGHGAVYLSKNMYTDESKYGVTSTLCYGVQWDATLRFIKDKVDVTNSKSWGNYYNSNFTFSGEYSKDKGETWTSGETTKPERSGWLLKTGASETNKAKNIYDLAGNVSEWTMETKSSMYRVVRGGGCNGYGGGDPASFRGWLPCHGTYGSIGFRLSLYITNE